MTVPTATSSPSQCHVGTAWDKDGVGAALLQFLLVSSHACSGPSFMRSGRRHDRARSVYPRAVVSLERGIPATQVVVICLKVRPSILGNVSLMGTHWLIL